MRTVAELLIEMGTLMLDKTEENHQKFCDLMYSLSDDEKSRMIKFSKTFAKQLDRGY